MVLHPCRFAPLLAVFIASASTAAAPIPDPTKPVAEIRFSQTTLSDALDFLRESSGANIEVDWKALEVVGINKDTPVSLRLRNVPLRVAIHKTLDSAAPGLADFYVQGNVITITSHEVADSQLVTRILPVEDLLLEVPDFTGPTLDLTQTGNANGGRNASGRSGSGASTSSSGGGGSGSIFSQTNKTDEKQQTREEKAADLIETIQTTIKPNVWDINGGKSHIKYFNGKLIITAPLSVQNLIG